MRAEASAEFDWWFRAAYPRIVRTVFLIVHDRGRAEEIGQDAFLELYRRWSTLQGYERPDAWVRRVAVQRAVKHVRRERMRGERERLVAVEEELSHLPDPDVARAVRTLSPMQRAAVVLHYWADEPVADIAADLGVSESTVKQHLFRARQRLAVLLREEVGDHVG
ncbi:RNA polymerase sigma factor [Oryzobacter sp. R7]|uniref:RNA polymerase sigma factor n=1 Tax=Oryzobacter faecalis TaxID=3388656 RepID=UPI00398D32D4